MVAYSFRERFVKRIEVGLSSVSLSFDPPPKRQTIRANGKRRHARPGEIVQLYYAQRTKQCRRIGVGRCTESRAIVLTFGKLSGVSIGGLTETDGSVQRQTHYQGTALDDFAQMDGFESWRELVDFWKAEHGTLESFVGTLIEWEPIR